MLAKAVAARDWHASDSNDILAEVASTADGLSAIEAARRLLADGPNRLPAVSGPHAVLRFLAHFHSALIYFLLAAAIAASMLGHAVDAVVILCIVVVNAVVGFVQEGKAEQSLNAIRQSIAPSTTVLRDARRQSIAVSDLVRGDVVILEAGDRVPADLRLLRARGLLIDEAMLTGESVAAAKHYGLVTADAALGDRHNMAFSGTLVRAGSGTAIVVETGIATQIGAISSLLQGVAETTTPLLRQIEQFSQRFTWIVIAFAAALFAFAVLARGFDWPEALIAVVALAVGVIPEGLPAVITITLAIGVRRMAARNAIIRKLPAVETLGAISVICSDKTGTLTKNEMIARRVVTPDHVLIASGSGYEPTGTLVAEDGTDAPALDAAQRLLRCAVLCNDAVLRNADGHWRVDGDPMEGALVALASKAGTDAVQLRADWVRLDEIPFDAKHRFMATLHRSAAGEVFAFVKGAPEALFGMANAPLDIDLWNERIAAAGELGERVLAFGSKPLDASVERLTFDTLSGGVDFLGIVGFTDPPRPEALAAVAECRSAGIAVKMITGDHVATALAIARQLGIADDPQAVTGAELDALSDAELERLVERVAVFARTSPEHKLRIVRALQADGAIVAMTGDGVNDAPSLKQADVGIAMGHKGTEAAKEAAAMVLLDDNFAAIVDAVEEGRTVYDNIRKVIIWTLPTNGGETLAVVLAILAGFALPMTATQILWTNLVLAGTLGLALAFEPAEPGVMQRQPRPAGAPLLSRYLFVRVVVSSSALAAVLLGVYFLALDQGRDLATARTIVVNLVVVCGVVHLFNVRFLHATSITWRGALGTPPVLAALGVVIVAQLLFTYAPFMQILFESRSLGLADTMTIICVGILLLLVLEVEKQLLRWFGWS